MADIGRVTPGKPIWPDPHEERPKRQRHEQGDWEDSRSSPGEGPDGHSDGERPEGHDDGHVDEYV